MLKPKPCQMPMKGHGPDCVVPVGEPEREGAGAAFCVPRSTPSRNVPQPRSSVALMMPDGWVQGELPDDGHGDERSHHGQEIDGLVDDRQSG